MLTMELPARMCGTPYLQNRKTERRLTAITLSQSSSATSKIGVKVIMAASLTITSMWVHLSTAALITACTSAEFETSALAKILSPPASLIAFTVALPCSSFRSTTTTFAPSAAKRSHVACPIPDPPPLTTHTLFLNRITHPCSSVIETDAETFRRQNLAPLFDEPLVSLTYRSNLPIQIIETDRIDTSRVLSQRRVPVHLIRQAVPGEAEYRHAVQLQPVHVDPFLAQPLRSTFRVLQVGLGMHHRQTVAAEILVR